MKVSTEEEQGQGATVVITHRVKKGQHSGYESWLGEIAPISTSYPGCVDWQLIRPVAGLTSTYTVIIRFDTDDRLRDWMESEDRKRLIDKVRPLLAKDDDFFISSGLDFWFPHEHAGPGAPVRWKQFLVTWSAIYPLVLGVPFGVVPLLQRLGVGENRYFTTLCVTGTVVALMTYLIMPRYTRLIRPWLFPKN